MVPFSYDALSRNCHTPRHYPRYPPLINISAHKLWMVSLCTCATCRTVRALLPVCHNHQQPCHRSVRVIHRSFVSNLPRKQACFRTYSFRYELLKGCVVNLTYGELVEWTIGEGGKEIAAASRNHPYLSELLGNRALSWFGSVGLIHASLPFSKIKPPTEPLPDGSTDRIELGVHIVHDLFTYLT